MMVPKPIVLLCCFLAAVLAVPVEKYTDKYDNIDLKEIMGNKKLFEAYANCLLEKGKCTSEGKELKGHIHDALKTGCEKCTEAQINGTTTMIDHMIKNERGVWRELTAKYDPEGIWRKKYEDRAREKGIVIPED